MTLIGVTPGGEITDEMLVGGYFWYSIGDAMVPLATVRAAFEDAGLDVSRLPEERRPEHVAQEACRCVEETRSNGTRIVIRAEQVDRDKHFLIYQITRHVQDKANRVIEHPKALRVLYSFDDGSLSFEQVDAGEQVDGLQARIQAHFDANQAKMPGHKLRTILRHYIEEAGAENMRGKSGGVYFIAKNNPLPTISKLRPHHGDSIDGFSFLAAIQKMLGSVYGTVDTHIVPCVNSEGERDFIKRKFIENCAGDLKEYRDELVELVATKDKRIRGFRADAVTNLVNRRKAMDERKAKFASILGETMEELDRDMKLADAALAKFMEATINV